MISEDIQYIKSLEDGWNDGEGQAFARDELDGFAQDLRVFLQTYSLVEPKLIPWNDRTIILEWRTETHVCVIELLLEWWRGDGCVIALNEQGKGFQICIDLENKGYESCQSCIKNLQKYFSAS